MCENFCIIGWIGVLIDSGRLFCELVVGLVVFLCEIDCIMFCGSMVMICDFEIWFESLGFCEGFNVVLGDYVIECVFVDWMVVGFYLVFLFICCVRLCVVVSSVFWSLCKLLCLSVLLMLIVMRVWLGWFLLFVDLLFFDFVLGGVFYIGVVSMVMLEM